jgi:hypothetical protein
LAAAAAFVLAWFSMRPLSYEVSGATGPSAQGDYIAAAEPGRDAKVTFEEGSVFVLGAGARGRVVDTSSEGAELALEEGKARVAVRHKAGARWVVHAGPFAVHVKGTKFDVRWSAGSQELEITLQEGSLLVVGPIAGRSIALNGGERLLANAQRREVKIEALVAAPAQPTRAGDASAVQPGPNVVDADPPNAAPADAPSAARPASSSWAGLLETGAASEVVAQAEAAGVQRCLLQCSSQDLRALADAARYTKRVELAQVSLEALRKRFGGSRAAQDAALHLGRLYDDARGDAKTALRWYEQYLKEAPAGPFAGDALGRKMLAERKLIGIAAAKRTAQTYLVKHPKGTYAKAAQELVAQPDHPSERR